MDLTNLTAGGLLDLVHQVRDGLAGNPNYTAPGAQVAALTASENALTTCLNDLAAPEQAVRTARAALEDRGAHCPQQPAHRRVRLRDGGPQRCIPPQRRLVPAPHSWSTTARPCARPPPPGKHPVPRPGPRPLDPRQKRPILRSQSRHHRRKPGPLHLGHPARRPLPIAKMVFSSRIIPTIECCSCRTEQGEFLEFRQNQAVGSNAFGIWDE